MQRIPRKFNGHIPGFGVAVAKIKARQTDAEILALVEALPFILQFNQKANHAILLGLMKPSERWMSLPCVLHLLDMGSMRITANAAGATLDYDALAGYRLADEIGKWVR